MEFINYEYIDQTTSQNELQIANSNQNTSNKQEMQPQMKKHIKGNDDCKDKSYKKQQQSQQIDKNIIKKCDFKEINLLYKLPKEYNQFLMIGDLLIDLSNDVKDFDYFVNICNLYLQKKRVVQVIYDKISNLIDMQYENSKSGQNNFDLVKAKLINSQNQNNYLLAQKLSSYEQFSFEVNIQYLRFFTENEEEIVRQFQQDFLDKTKQELISTMNQNQQDFYQYIFYSYIDKNEMGYPIQIQQGISEAVAALFGLEVDQIIELIKRHGFLEHLVSNCLDQIFIENRAFQQIMLMENVEYFTRNKDIYDQKNKIITFDGITVNLQLIIKQISQYYNGTIISTFTYITYQIDSNELQKVLQIRQSQTNIYSAFNIIDLIFENPYNKNALKFANYIKNDNNFRPMQNQDLYPQKTCKYKQIEQQQN